MIGDMMSCHTFLLRGKYHLITVIFIYFLCFHGLICGETDYSIVFVHLGDQVPEYAETALKQARLFNPSCPIVLIANDKAINVPSLQDHLRSDNITYISCEDLKLSDAHKKFIKTTNHNSSFRNGFWRYTSERFLYLYDLMSQYDLRNVFHLEYDNMLYSDLSELVQMFEESYKGIAATFDNETRCIPGFIYIKNRNSMKLLAECFADHAASKKNDMQVIGVFKNNNRDEIIDYLPIIQRKYLAKYTLFGQAQFNLKNKYDFCKNIEKFDAVFDAAALGQYLGGIDPRNGESKPGFINESCIFDPSKLRFTWSLNEKGLWVPYVAYANEKRKVINLHIHSKKLELFSSLVPQKPFVLIK